MVKIPITFNSDEKGYFDRECPNDNCLYTFKIHMEDWKEKVSDEEVHCPMCGYVAESDKWWTQKQLKDMENIAQQWALSYIQGELDKSFRKLEHSTRGNKFVKITYKPDRKITFINNPLGQMEEWEQEKQCPKCQTRYSVIGTAYFCPCCGYNGIEDAFIDSLNSIVKMIEALPDMEPFIAQSQGKDVANTMCRNMLEGSLGDVVSAFQKFAELRFKAISLKPVKVNDFQIVEKGSRLFSEETGNGYDRWLTTDEISEMNLMFQRRHIIEHNAGIVDNQYISKSGDTAYSEGQRLVIHEADILRLIKIITKLGKGLKELKAATP